MNAMSFKISARRRYIFRSGSRAVPKRYANKIVARRPADSCRIDSNSAAVGEAVESPTPTLDRTAREESSPAMLLEKA